MKTINEINPGKDELLDIQFNYQTELTEKLDNLKSDFNQEVINEIVLWKVNRYAEISSDAINTINKIDKNSSEIDYNLTDEILKNLLAIKGIRLPMASTLLRFKNPQIYQIIDQRVYRLIYGEKLILKKSLTDNITQYLNYLDKLRNICIKFEIPFSKSDRILYQLDKNYNIEKIQY